MSLFGFLGEVIEAGVRVVATPITIVEDVISPLSGESGKKTSKNIRKIGDNLGNAIDNLTGDD